jgi:Zn-dependent protease
MTAKDKRGSRWSLQLGRVLGIPIRIHFTFLLLLVWYGYYSTRHGDSAVLAVSFLILVFGCVVLHELGHATMARRFGVRTREIVLYPIGGIARLENIPEGRAELLIAMAGPAVNAVLAAALFLAILVWRLPFLDLEQLLSPADVVGRLFLVNIVLFCFNLLPAFPMDGGRVLRASLSLAISPERATEIAATVGQGVAILFAAAGILLPNILLMIIALFVYIGASQEAFFYRQRAVIAGKTAREAMITRFETLAPQTSLGEAGEQLLATHQQDFPVVDVWDRVVGILPRSRLLQGLAERGDAAAVLDVMEREVPAVGPDDDLDRVLRQLRGKPDCPVLVLHEGKLLGMITLANLSEYIQIARRVAGS